MRSQLIRSAVALAGLLATVTGTAAAAVPALPPGGRTVTHGPISITVPAVPSFQHGTITTMLDFCGSGQPFVYTGANVAFTWSAKSTAGPVVRYDIYDETFSGTFYDRSVTVPGISAWVDNYIDDCGGGSGKQYGWLIVARDRAGHSVQASVEAYLYVTRFDNTGAEGAQGTWTYTGRWGVSTCLCADGYRQTYTTAAGASATFAVTAKAGERLALMMAEGPGRGSARILLDGRITATINTYASTNSNRVITWSTGALKAGPHLVTIVNLATPGHPRVDVNAALTERPLTFG